MIPASRRLGAALLGAMCALAMAAGAVGTNPPDRQYPDHVYAPPMPPRVIDADGRWRAPFVYPLRLEDRLTRRFAVDSSRPVPLRLFQDGGLIGVAAGEPPWFPLGTDSLGRDVLARLAAGARTSLAVAACSALGALVIGAIVGAVAGYRGGAIDLALMRTADFLIALPILYVVIALRAAAPLVLSPAEIFWTLVAVFSTAGWPIAARGVRAIVAVERNREYAEAARSAGAGSVRILLHHLLPATRGFLVTQATLLIPAFIVSEATLSFVGLGFSEPISSWGAMLQEAGRGRALADAPWLLAPAAAIVWTILAVNLVARSANSDRLLLLQAAKWRS